MRIAQCLCSLLVGGPSAWTADWAWGILLIMLTVLIHVLGFGLTRTSVLTASKHMVHHRHPIVLFVTFVGLMTMLATGLHAIEACIWAGAYRLLGALPENKSAMLYSLNAMTSYGHTNLTLDEHWQLMGAMEALNGWLLFGLSTAFLFSVVAKAFSALEEHEHNGAKG